ncbi:YqhR family membrane protein [Paenibacillus sp. Marseille-Q7038]
MNHQQKRTKRTNPLLFGLEIGFFAGLFWGGIQWVFYIFHFTVIPTGFIAEPFFKHSFIYSAPGQWLGWAFFIGFSILATLLYILTLRKLRGPIPGLLYGIVWWFLIFMWPGPILGMVKPITEVTWDTIYAEFCLFLLWGLFIGYSVAVEYTDERKREPEMA